MKSFHLYYNTLALLLIGTSGLAKETEVKGLLPELKVSSSEAENSSKEITSEMLITRAENKALESLQSLLLKKKGTSEEPYLLYRLAELYMKRSKSGRFFDLQRSNKSPFPIPAESSAEHIRKAIQVYNKITKDFPQFVDMDSVYFNNAFAHQQINLNNVSIQLYKELLAKYPKSNLVPDALLASGELLYNQQNFKDAELQFTALEKYPQSRVYTYGIYKLAWTVYNLHKNEEATAKLLLVVKATPSNADNSPLSKQQHNLRKEALRDLCIFIADSIQPQDVYPFFEKITSQDELAQAMTDMGKLYLSYSKFKELNVLMQKFTKEEPMNQARVQSHLLMVEAEESLKNRDGVIKQLKIASDLCESSSSWRKENKTEEALEACQKNFNRVSSEIAAKWWDIWLKNKNHKEFSNLTEQVLNIILQNEDIKNPDIKTRYALAELLFQQEKYQAAIEQYKIVSEKSEGAIRHDATYALLISLEKALSANNSSSDLKKLRILTTQKYLKEQLGGVYYSDVQFKLAFLQFEEKQFTESLKTLETLLAQNPPQEFKTKAQDLTLEIYNIQQNFSEIKKIAQKMSQDKALSSDRKLKLITITQEAHFAEIQKLAENGKSKEAVQELKSFITTNPGSTLTEAAYLQIISILMKEKKDIQAASEIETFAKRFPKNSKSLEALKEATAIFKESGQFKKAIACYEQLQSLDSKNSSAYRQDSINLLILDNDYSTAKNMLSSQISESSPSGPSAKLAQESLIKLYKLAQSNKDTALIEKLEVKISNQNIEPYATQILIRKALTAYNNKKYSDAFDLSLKANSRNVSAAIRSPARMLQAQILEQELKQQSVKAKIDRIALVLDLKTEKFDKAHTAYLSAAKMAETPEVKIAALEGLDRIYADYIQSLTNLDVTDSISQQDLDQLRQEMKKITEPIAQRKIDNFNQLKLARNASTKGDSNQFIGLLANETIKPQIQFPKAVQIQPLLISKNWTELALNKKWDQLEKDALEKFDQIDQRPQALVALSVVAEGRNQLDKALWLSEQSLIENKNAEYSYLQRARIVYLLDGKIDNALEDFKKSEKLKTSSSALALILGMTAYSQNNIEEAIKNFSLTKKEDAINLDVGSVISEAFAKNGNPDKALSIIKDHIKVNNTSIGLILQEAHILETYKATPAPALDLYSKALKLSKSPEMNEWLDAKIKYLKMVLPEAI